MFGIMTKSIVDSLPWPSWKRTIGSNFSHGEQWRLMSSSRIQSSQQLTNMRFLKTICDSYDSSMFICRMILWCHELPKHYLESYKPRLSWIGTNSYSFAQTHFKLGSTCNQTHFKFRLGEVFGCWVFFGFRFCGCSCSFFISIQLVWFPYWFLYYSDGGSRCYFLFIYFPRCLFDHRSLDKSNANLRNESNGEINIDEPIPLKHNIPGAPI